MKKHINLVNIRVFLDVTPSCSESCLRHFERLYCL